MPVYDYTCSACGHLTEVVHGIHDNGPRFCPECGAEGTMTKAFAAPAIHFKGSGWAKKDRSSAAKPPSKSKGDEPKGDEPKGDRQKGDDAKGDDSKSGGRPAATGGSPGEGSTSGGGSSSTPASD
jgi:putative FmdB family regulatory protein